MQNILNLDELDKIKGEIYKIINTKNYKIYISRNKQFKVSSKGETLIERLKTIIIKAKELKSKNDKDESERTMGYPQPNFPVSL